MGRPKQFDPDAAVARATEVFWRKGYADTTPQDLVDALGIGKGSLYNTFGSKHALFERALEHYRDNQSATVTGLLEQSGPVKERLRDALRLVAEANLTDPDRRGCLAVNTAAALGGVDAEATALVGRMFDRTEAAFQAAIEEGQRAGEIDRGRDPRATASMLLSTLVGMQVLSKTADGPDRSMRTIDAVIDSL
ncbi:TetR/AcrR family transcriptional regulator [Nocardia amikacinitolerans]|uniref:Transcriptional regulator, TetR family n=1 Tax=Nocardia amikacinitolerans TaxID=756689 RepID=A0A285LS15_9NOCA|nr:TetR/AcrR family transcriptional regulator [Nocardia amikacinitolerans]MCP2291644.1 transcriptional regulator, TetR family [Nocardia amikacinitolerans]MCP2319513.1 transcriptional regulator, TetR family [Nocardia amikacinitolerans]SNY87685.1 transcriptional regulator, TetR family [Nocardia amikacinitolerans]